jgi:hypothetical protein
MSFGRFEMRLDMADFRPEHRDPRIQRRDIIMKVRLLSHQLIPESRTLGNLRALHPSIDIGRKPTLSDFRMWIGDK